MSLEALEAARAQFRATYLRTLCSLIFFAGNAYFLIWTENQTVVASLALDEMMDVAVSAKTAGAGRVELVVVHVVGALRVLEAATDPDYSVHAQAVKLRRHVQMYKCAHDETLDEASIMQASGDSRKRKSYKEWRDYVEKTFFNSHQYPATMPVCKVYTSRNVNIGSLRLGAELKDKVNDYEDTCSDARRVVHFHGKSELRHEIGDLRVTFSYAGREGDIYTAVGFVEDGILQPYRPETVAGAEPVCLLYKGSYTLKQLLQLEHRSINLRAWKCRALGFVLVFTAVITLHTDWLRIFLHWEWLSPDIKNASLSWVKVILAVCYTLLCVAIPWLFTNVVPQADLPPATN